VSQLCKYTVDHSVLEFFSSAQKRRREELLRIFSRLASDTPNNREVQLPSEDHTGKCFPSALASDRFEDEVFVLAKEHSAEFTGTAKQIRI
jgi:hypothetical protein